MKLKLIKWDIYEIHTKGAPVTGVMLRGRKRKFGLEARRNILVENTEDKESCVRFATPSKESISSIKEYLRKIIPNVSIKLIMADVPNPVLSKLKVNLTDRYTL